MSQPESETFQHYQVLRREDGSLWELGRGAMGITYKAFDTNLRSYVALKVVNGLYLNSETARARFLREARAAAALRHRNVASVYHLGNDDQSFFYAMEFVDGETVAAMVEKTGPLPVARAVGIALQVARALGAAHKQNLVHRDIKPANLMVTREDEEDEVEIAEDSGHLHVKVIDFGLARSSLDAAGSSSGPITMGGFVGTAQFASPEQLEEREVDIRSDIYSLGITLWYLLAGQPPFAGSMFSLYSQHLTKEPPWGQLGDHVPPVVREALKRMLEKNPGDRFQTPAALRRALESCLTALPAGSGATALPRGYLGDDTDSEGGLRTQGSYGATRGGETLAAETLVEAVSPGTLAAPPTSQEPPSFVPTVPPSTASALPAQPGTLLGARYLLVKLVGEGSSGQVFLGQDTQDNHRSVAVKLAWPGAAASTAETFARMQEEFVKQQSAPHPNLLTVHTLGWNGDAPFFVTEWVNGFTLFNLLRHRGRLPVGEALTVLLPAAAAADHARLHQLQDLEVSPRQVLVGFDEETDGDLTGGERHIGTPLTAWPAHAVKLSALNLPARNQTAEGMTWSGDMTMVAAAHPISFLSTGAIADRQNVVGIALLAYELLDGAPPVEALAVGGRYTSLASLNEAGNDILRRALAPAQRTADQGEFPSALAFCEAFARAAGFEPTALRGLPPLSVASTSPGLRSTRPEPASTFAPGQTATGPTGFRPPSSTVPGPVQFTDTSGASRVAGEVSAIPAPEPPAAQPLPRFAPVAAPVAAPRSSILPWVLAGAALFLLAAGIAGYFLLAPRGGPGPGIAGATPGPSPAVAFPTPVIPPTPVPTPAPTPVLTPALDPTPAAATPTPTPKRVGPQTLQVPAQFATVQAAIEAAQPGDTVQLAPGSYPGPIIFKDRIRLIGASAANCLITTVEPDANAASSANTALVKVSDCRAGSIENLTLQGSGGVGPLGARQDGILLTNSSITVSGCQVTAMSGSGIVIHDTDSRPTITGNRCRLNGEHGIVFERGANGVAEKNNVENNEGCGLIVADRGTNPTLRGNEARENRRHGLNFLRGSAGTAERNTLIANGSSGIAVDSSDTVPTLRGNRCSGNRQHGLGYARGAAGLAEDNTLENNVGNGIFVHGSDTAPTLRNNRALNNRNNGLSFEKGAAGSAEDNLLEGNEGCGILISDPLTSPNLLRNTASKNKKYGVATVNAPQVKLDPSNKNIGNSQGAIIRQ